MEWRLFIFLGCVIHLTSGHSYHVGDCPSVEPMKNFNMEKFLGKWYVIQKTSSNNKHQILTYSKGEEDGEYVVLENAVRPIIGKTDYSGKLKPVQELPALMKVKFQLNPGSYNYIVFDTDYDNYAGVFSCQKVLGTNRRAASILSRRPTLDRSFVDKVRDKLSEFGVSIKDLKVIIQEHDDHDSSEEAAGRGITNEDKDKAPVYDIDPRFGQVQNPQNYNASDLHLFKK